VNKEVLKEKASRFVQLARAIQSLTDAIEDLQVLLTSEKRKGRAKKLVKNIKIMVRELNELKDEINEYKKYYEVS